MYEQVNAMVNRVEDMARDTLGMGAPAVCDPHVTSQGKQQRVVLIIEGIACGLPPSFGKMDPWRRWPLSRTTPSP